MTTPTPIPVAILTSEREEETLSRTIRSLTNAGFSRFYIYYDLEKSGIWPGYQTLANETSKLFGTETPVLIVEDDIVVCRDLHRYLQKILANKLAPDVGLISLYLCEWTRKKLFFGLRNQLMASPDASSICGALAWLWNPNVLRQMVDSDDLERNDMMRTDVHVPKWLAAHNYKMLHHIPSLSNHADNDCSTYQNNQPPHLRHADSFPGESESPFQLRMKWE